jgi:predicted phosphodiesterase
MKLFVASDLHCEFFKGAKDKLLHTIPKGIDGVIIAGDLTTNQYLDSMIGILCENVSHLFYVAGNHEYYGSSFEEVDDTLLQCYEDYDNFHWLNMNGIKIDGHDFVGCTLWFEKNDMAIHAQQYMNDFFLIKYLEKFVYRENELALQFLTSNVTHNSIVITHHLPTMHSVHEKYKNSMLNPFFVSPSAEHIILENKPKIWIHGHTHSAFDYILDETRIICNPYGYYGDFTEFRRDKIIEV